MDRCGCLYYGVDDPAVQVYGLGAAAMRLQQRGYAVLPLARGEKRPHRMLGDQGGVHWATLDTGAAHWWEQDPAANVGVATGQASCLVVIDLDVKNGQNGTAAFTGLLNEHRLEWPLDAPWAQTPSGGWHAWLRTPPGVAVPERPGILPGVDVKGDGGLVVAPPSMQLRFPMVRPGERSRGEPVPVPYRWVSGCPCVVPAAPGWLLPWLTTAPVAGSSHSSGGGEIGGAPDNASLQRTGIPVGQRNRELYRYACARYRLHGTSTQAAALVMADVDHVLARTDRRDFSRGEVLRILESARRFVAGRQESEAAAVARWRRTAWRTSPQQRSSPGTGS